ncbi:hypothetical protein AVEN_228228-1 [Araneus ventricosus]|uniref:Uncharacterized protein n=1 Tax=Araneus ventricosus TaxID=182803 RepID=A0A4Y2DAQ5_ARAVE|nr:hypothetical protein AVEN_228228-1 [Araneus ventricosus]
MYHPSNGTPRTANTWGYIAVHEKQEAIRVATASHGELPRLRSREGRKRQKLKGRKKQKGEQTLGYLGAVKPVTPEEDVPLRGVSNGRDQYIAKGKEVHDNIRRSHVSKHKSKNSNY